MSEETHDEDEEEEAGSGIPGWLTTFADLMSLLLTFFILLLSFAELNQKKFHSVIESINIAFRGNPGPPGDSALNSLDKFHIQDKAANSAGESQRNVDSLFMAQIQDATQNDLNSQRLSWVRTAKGVKVTIPTSFVFVPGTVIITERAKVILRKIIRKTKYFEYGLIVKTHTGDRPINNPLFPSNWEFSLRRSVKLMRFILKESKIPSSWAKAVGYAHSMPLYPNTSDENRQKNSRVEIEYEIKKVFETPKDRARAKRNNTNLISRYRTPVKRRSFNTPKESLGATRSSIRKSY